MSKFVLIFIGGHAKPEERSSSMKEWEIWNNELVSSGVVVDGMPFDDKNKVVTGPENNISDYSGDASGYMIVQVESMEDAISIAKTALHQKRGGKTEIFWTMTM